MLTDAEAIQACYGDTFWDKVEPANGDACREINLKTSNRSGHVDVRMRRAGLPSIKAHRAAFMLTWGEIPKGVHILHTCGNPKCCNPFHLYAGTNQHNVRDAIEAGTHNFVQYDARFKEQILDLVSKRWSHTDVALHLNCSQAYVSKVASGEIE